MSDKPTKAPAKGAVVKAEAAEVDTEQGEEKPKSKLGWIVGWVLVPGTVIGLIFGSGALIGAHFSESWFTRMIVWVVEIFV